MRQLRFASALYYLTAISATCRSSVSLLPPAPGGGPVPNPEDVTRRAERTLTALRQSGLKCQLKQEASGDDDMANSLTERLVRAPVVPLIQTNDPETAVGTARALLAGGLGVIEVVLRSDEALDCLQRVVLSVPDAIVGAGTVLNADQGKAAIEAGAAFIVSPGLDEDVVRLALDAGLPVFPGVATATEVQAAWNLGLDTVKFFPAGLAGGSAMLKALAAIFRRMRFMPTGGVSAANLAEFLSIPSVIACGGSWLTPAKETSAGNFSAITGLAQEALAIAASARKT